MNNSQLIAGKETYAGLFFITLATLMLEILLLRIFSVTMWYHFAFMAISIALFGMTVGAVLVYLLPRLFTYEKTKKHLSWSAFLFGILTVASFVAYLIIPFAPPAFSGSFFSEFKTLFIIYLVSAIPFIASGVTVSLALTRFPKQTSALYAADMIGAAFGCIILVAMLYFVTAPTAVFLAAFFALVGAFAFSVDSSSRLLKIGGALFAAIFLIIAIFNTHAANNQNAFIKLTYVKGAQEKGTIYERWNSFSRITIWGDKEWTQEPFGWGFSPLYPPKDKIHQLWLFIDATAGTPLTGFNGDIKSVEFLKYDIVNLAHYIRPQSDVLVIGAGGGRDILSALVFDQKSVTGVEVNENIIDAVHNQFGDFTGHLDQNPKVNIVHGEGRNYIAQSGQKFDIIQASLIDSWAATAAGAFVLTENSLYTVEGWNIFLEHLSERGVLTFSRWYFHEQPGEVYRLVSLAAESLREIGITKPMDHIIVARRLGEGDNPDAPDGIGTILVSRSPFTDADVATIESVVSNLGFDLVLTPRYAIDDTFAALVSPSAQDNEKLFAELPLKISAPTDDSPFFFQMLRFKDMFKSEAWNFGKMSMNMKAVAVIGMLLVISLILVLFFIITPLIFSTARGSTGIRSILPFIIYFAFIGLGFILIEISQMQRLIIFLGNPVHSLSVLLFSLLISSGIGSLFTQRISDINLSRNVAKLLLALIASLVIFGVATPLLITFFGAAPQLIRILLSILIMFPIGLFMGMAFPIGIRIAMQKMPRITPLLGGVNGATSVFASVLAYAIALNAGNFVVFWAGVFCYVGAFLCFFKRASSSQNEY